MDTTTINTIINSVTQLLILGFGVFVGTVIKKNRELEADRKMKISEEFRIKKFDALVKLTEYLGEFDKCLDYAIWVIKETGGIDHPAFLEGLDNMIISKDKVYQFASDNAAFLPDNVINSFPPFGKPTPVTDTAIFTVQELEDKRIFTQNLYHLIVSETRKLLPS